MNFRRIIQRCQLQKQYLKTISRNSNEKYNITQYNTVILESVGTIHLLSNHKS
jgi:hypothetical protein